MRDARGRFARTGSFGAYQGTITRQHKANRKAVAQRIARIQKTSWKSVSHAFDQQRLAKKKV